MAKFRALHTASFLQLHMAGFAAKFECPLFTQIDCSGLPSGHSAHDVDELQSLADDLFTACAAIGLNVNVAKTKWLSTEDGRRIVRALGILPLVVDSN
uniref:Uncharacterized protein n=1 Tax=Plectus sambesii TaxID=2011161 RepID=A0A914VQJ4_9BILA